MEILENMTFDEERALYGRRGVAARGCRFDGPADGESAFKECEDISAEDCFFNLRYPFWHGKGLRISRCELTELCRAALWYSEDIVIRDSKMHGIKALRECSHADIRGCDIDSPEFGWSVRGLTMEDCKVRGEYFMLRSEGLHFRNVDFTGKYSFQYIKNCTFENCVLDTKDAFWHAENVTVKNCTVKGEYLAWYSSGLTLENCVITGTQPLCWCKGLRLIDCEMHGADLSFEKSDVNAVITTPVDSIKNPRSGRITVPSAGEIIRDGGDANCEIIILGE